jgi:hypothetical protein
MDTKTPLEVREYISKKQEDFFIFGEHALTKGQKGACVGTLNIFLNGDANRKIVLAWIFSKEGELSTKELDESAWWALYEWMDWYPDENGKWKVSSSFPTECMLVLQEAIRTYASLRSGAGSKFRENVSSFDDLDAQLLTAIGFNDAEITAMYNESGKEISKREIKYKKPEKKKADTIYPDFLRKRTRSLE